MTNAIDDRVAARLEIAAANISSRRARNATYRGVHRRLRMLRGAANGHLCADCSKPAKEWAYDHSDPNAATCPRTGMLYSPDIAHYSPRCRSCHEALDSGPRPLKDMRLPGWADETWPSA